MVPTPAARLPPDRRIAEGADVVEQVGGLARQAVVESLPPRPCRPLNLSHLRVPLKRLAQRGENGFAMCRDYLKRLDQVVPVHVPLGTQEVDVGRVPPARVGPVTGGPPGRAAGEPARAATGPPSPAARQAENPGAAATFAALRPRGRCRCSRA